LSHTKLFNRSKSTKYTIQAFNLILAARSPSATQIPPPT
jgi:hypothetical protein